MGTSMSGLTRPGVGPHYPMRSSNTKIAAGMMAVAAALVVSACGSRSNTSAMTTSSSISQTATSTHVATSAPSGNVASSWVSSSTHIASSVSITGSDDSKTAPASGGSSSPCADQQITVSAATITSAGGHSGVSITFTNDSATACTLTGYPGVAGLDAKGHQIQQARRTTSGYLAGTDVPVTTVDLAPHAHASAIVEGTNNPAGASTTCPTLTGLVVTAPGTRESHHVTSAPGACSGLTVHPVTRP